VTLKADRAGAFPNVVWGKAEVDGKIVQFSNLANVIVDPSVISELAPCGSPTGGTITAIFGQIIPGGPEKTHTGIDIASDLPFWKQDVYSPLDGYISAAYSGPFRGLVSVKTVNGLYQVDFVHLHNYLNVIGKEVKRGDWIGDTHIGPIPGYSSGTHLHYRVKKSGQNVDPMSGEFSINRRSVGQHLSTAQDCSLWAPP
jgi:murein DD-endopeptidase MepM/ murein hydrolase activator NlpD